MATRNTYFAFATAAVFVGVLLILWLKTDGTKKRSEIAAVPAALNPVPPTPARYVAEVSTEVSGKSHEKTVAAGSVIPLEEVFRRHPGYQAAWNANFGRQILDGYGDLKARFSLDDETYRILSKLLVEEKWVRVDAVEVLKQRGITTDHPEFGKYLAHIASSLEGEIKQVVGVDNYDMLRLTPRIVRLEGELYTKYAGEFSAAGYPLTTQQVKDLAVSMAVADKLTTLVQAIPVRKFRPGPDQEFLSESQAAQLEAAKSILMNEQLEVLKRRFQELNMEEYYLHMYSQKK